MKIKIHQKRNIYLIIDYIFYTYINKFVIHKENLNKFNDHKTQISILKSEFENFFLSSSLEIKQLVSKVVQINLDFFLGKNLFGEIFINNKKNNTSI